MAKALDVKALDRILDRMINTLTDSKDEIFQIGEQCRNDYETLSRELRELRTMIAKIIDEGDRLETLAQSARNHLSTVSRNFNEYSEEQVKEAYEKAHQIQMDYIMNRELEKQLRKRRDELERRLQGLHETIERAEHLVAQTTFVLNYLTSDLKQVGEVLEEAKMKQDFGLKIIMAQEEERKRLSREIHDGPAQMLANVMMRSDLVERLFKEYGSEAALEEIRSLKKMVRDALYECGASFTICGQWHLMTWDSHPRSGNICGPSKITTGRQPSRTSSLARNKGLIQKQKFPCSALFRKPCKMPSNMQRQMKSPSKLK